jgi:hypothetical protein
VRSSPHSKAVQAQERTITGESVHPGAPVQRRYGSTWQKRRDLVLSQRGRRCEVCGASGADDGIRVHHLSYENFGNELDADLFVVCRRGDRSRVILRRSPALQALVPLSSTVGSVLCSPLAWLEIPAYGRTEQGFLRFLHELEARGPVWPACVSTYLKGAV